ncbi:sulfate/molybdate ABC transporter ATP-binding protein [Leptothrix discophora]|uniref:ATP-binding cassette domain-containing protein n=1 Tax=Leptothrix discophora TaxID=89 RepID=A0ABT9G158_LEPDI|nr:ATP-binding cassette domain-containing protein [Leptothrix discophora]MDP4300017.1 ATP-binding cassette domain-containing protein [Leptothrix discophora]
MNAPHPARDPTPDPAPHAGSPWTWDIALQRRLRQGEARFTLDVQWRSTARRVVLHGPSGAGKSQTLRLIAGIDRPDAGRIAVAGREICDTAAGRSLSPQARSFGLMFQDYALFPHLSVRQNIAFGRRTGWLNPGREAADAEVERWIDAFGLRSLAGQLPHQLSGGQRQRTALARALAIRPRALLLDEPFAALDSGLRRSLRAELLALQTELDLPLLLITHDEEDVQALAQHVVQIEAGRVVNEVPA